MGFDNRYPYTDMHELNLDWILEQMKTLAAAWDAYQESLTGDNGEWPTFKAYIENEWQTYQDGLTGVNGEWPTFKAYMENAWQLYQDSLTGVNGAWPQFKTQMETEWQQFFDNYLQTLGVVQVTGQSTTSVMSQKATTDELDKKENVGASELYPGNLIPKINMKKHYYISWVDGSEQYLDQYTTTDYFEVNPNTTYYGFGVRYGAWYDVDKQFISGFNGMPPTSPATAKYCRISGNHTENEYGTWFVGTLTDYDKIIKIKNLEIDLLQTSGSSTTKPISQKATTDLLNERVSINAAEIYPGNLLPKINVKDGYYISWLDGYEQYNAAFKASDYIEIQPSTDYYGFGIKYGAFYDADKTFISGITSLPITAPATAKYCRISGNYNDNEYGTWFFGTSSDYAKAVKFKNLEIDLLQNPGSSAAKPMSQKDTTDFVNSMLANISKGFQTNQMASMNANDAIEFPTMNIKKNQIYSFACKVTTMGEIQIGHGENGYGASYLSLTNTNADTTDYDVSAHVTSRTHGLTIQDYLFITIYVKDDTTADIDITSNGNTYSITGATWHGDSNEKTYVKIVTGSYTECVFTYTAADLTKNVYMFGDSYFGMTDDNRWVYYLLQHGYKNYLLNAYAGENSAGALASLQNMIANGFIPKIIVWCMGMNDGSDNGGTPSATWSNGISTLLSICQANNIVPILATIPTVPIVNNEAKNTYVRNSGYRYIDFAEAVGAQSDGTWYANMLSGDNVHPATLGAFALYSRAIQDCPEITF